MQIGEHKLVQNPRISDHFFAVSFAESQVPKSVCRGSDIFRLRSVWSSISDLVPVAELALRMVPDECTVIGTEPIDGSSKDGLGGWAVVILAFRKARKAFPGAGLTKICFIGGRGAVNGTNFIGAQEADSLESELPAMASTMSIIASGQFDGLGCRNFEVWADNTTAIQVAQGFDLKIDFCDLRSVVGARARDAKCGRRIEVKHIKGHIGHPWNETTDAIAKWFRQDMSLLDTEVAERVTPEGAQAVDFRKFSFISSLPEEGQTQCPDSDKDGIEMLQPSMEIDAAVIAEVYNGLHGRVIIKYEAIYQSQDFTN